MQHELTLHVDGKLTRSQWVYDETLGEGNYELKNVTYRMFDLLDIPFGVEDGATIRSLLIALTNNQLRDYEEYNRQWNNACVYQAIAFYQRHKDRADLPPRDSDVEFLEVYRMFTLDPDTKVLDYALSMPSFHGCSAATTLNYCVSYSNPATFWDIPLRLNHDAVVYSDDMGSQKVFEFKAPYTLREVIRAIFWELSWGGPATKYEKDFLVKFK